MLDKSKQKKYFSSTSQSEKKKTFPHEYQLKFTSRSIYENNNNYNSSFIKDFNDNNFSSGIGSPQKSKYKEFIEDLNKTKFSINNENSGSENKKVYNSNVIDILNSLNFFSNNHEANLNSKNNKHNNNNSDTLSLEEKKKLVSTLRKDIETLEIEIWKQRSSLKEIQIKKKNIDGSSNYLNNESEAKFSSLNAEISQNKEKLKAYELQQSETLKQIENNKKIIKRLCDKKSFLLRESEKFMKQQESIKNELEKKISIENKKKKELKSFLEISNGEKNMEINKNQQILSIKQKDREKLKKETLELEGIIKLFRENSVKTQIKELTEFERVKRQIETFKITNNVKFSNEQKNIEELQKNKQELANTLNLFEQKKEAEISKIIEQRKIQIDSFKKKLNENKLMNAISEKKLKSISEKLRNENDSKEQYIENLKLELDKIDIEFEDYSTKMEGYLSQEQKEFERLEEKKIMLLNFKKRKSVTIDVTQKNLIKKAQLIEANKEIKEELEELNKQSNEKNNKLNELICTFSSKKSNDNEYQTIFENNTSLEKKIEEVSIHLEKLDYKKKEKSGFLKNLKESNEKANTNGLALIEKNKVLEKRLESANKTTKKKKGFFF